MELIPKFLIVGLFTPPPGIPGGFRVTIEKLNEIWAEVAPTYGFRQLNISPDGSGAEFLGVAPEEGVVIQPPLLQVRDPVALQPRLSIEAAQDIIRTVSDHLNVQDHLYNLGIRHVYHAPAPAEDGRGFVLERLLGKKEDDLDTLLKGKDLWAGVKFVTSENDETLYTLVIEPLQVDDTMLFIDMDAQWLGETSIDDIAERAEEARTYVEDAVSRYLDSL